MKKITSQILLSLSAELKEKIQRQADREKRSRHAQIIYIIENHYRTAVKRRKNNELGQHG